jgi:hypothetical protein
MAERVINIEDFFTVDNENEGMWFEPKVNGEPCGIEFLVTGRGSSENTANTERYEKELAKLQDIKDPIEKVDKAKELDANFVATFVKGIRPAEGAKLNFGGKPLEYSVPLIQKFLFKSPLIKGEIVAFAKDTTNFIKREKND